MWKIYICLNFKASIWSNKVKLQGIRSNYFYCEHTFANKFVSKIKIHLLQRQQLLNTDMNFSCGQENNQLNITETSVSWGDEIVGTYELYKRSCAVRLGPLKIMRIRISSKVLWWNGRKIQPDVDCRQKRWFELRNKEKSAQQLDALKKGKLNLAAAWR